jgi:hypothetical protein
LHFPTEQCQNSCPYLKQEGSSEKGWAFLPASFWTLPNSALDFRNGHFPKQLPSHEFLKQGPFLLVGPAPALPKWVVGLSCPPSQKWKSLSFVVWWSYFKREKHSSSSSSCLLYFILAYGFSNATTGFLS